MRIFHRKRPTLLSFCLIFFAVILLLIFNGLKKEENPADRPAPTMIVDNGNRSENQKPTPSEKAMYPEGTKIPESTAAPTPAYPVLDLDGHSITCIVNREYTLSEDFVPEGLTAPDICFPYSDTTIDKAKMTPEAGKALAVMFNAAYEEDKLVLYGVSAYRSYARQYTIYQNNLNTYGIAHTNQFSAAPGRSEHQTGLAIDISCKSENFELEDSFALTSEGKWVADNAHRFGFILRYPKDKEEITGYAYEPWHVRYVGTELAEYLYQNDLTLEEYYGVPNQLTREYLDTTSFLEIP